MRGAVSATRGAELAPHGAELAPHGAGLAPHGTGLVTSVAGIILRGVGDGCGQVGYIHACGHKYGNGPGRVGNPALVGGIGSVIRRKGRKGFHGVFGEIRFFKQVFRFGNQAVVDVGGQPLYSGLDKLLLQGYSSFCCSF
ncbi:MAG: hypothetical protein LBB68_07560 [Treponema sp.]|jgi:hypothetical protein|nr:hypothetical protein [Treponema sp.]